MARVYLNGHWLAPEAACVSVMDRGFLFGDGVYEVIPIYSRRPFRLEQHLQRLQQSLDGIQLANPYSDATWGGLITQLADEAEWEDQNLYIQLTRGPMAIRNQAFPAEVTPTVFLMTEMMTAPTQSQLQRGVAAMSATDIRWLRCDLKTTSLLANCLLRQAALAAGCDEALLFRDGFLTEGSVSSIFVVHDDIVSAPKKNHLTLPGITYDVILELAAEHGMPYQVRDITETETRNADELWLASSTREVLPIVTLDGQRVGKTGQPGPFFTAMQAWYQSYKAIGMRHG